MERFTDLETHLATLGALPNLAQASDYLSALSISDRMLQVVLGSQLKCVLQASVQSDISAGTAEVLAADVVTTFCLACSVL